MLYGLLTLLIGILMLLFSLNILTLKSAQAGDLCVLKERYGAFFKVLGALMIAHALFTLIGVY